MSMRIKSREGFNFDRLDDLLTNETFNQIGKTQLYVSEMFKVENNGARLVGQLIEHKCGRVVGLIVRKSCTETLLIALGEWSSKIQYDLYEYGRREDMYIFPVLMLSDDTIDILQSGLNGLGNINTPLSNKLN